MHRWLPAFIFWILVAGCATHHDDAARASMASISVAPYVRIDALGTNRVELQIAAREFVPPHPGAPVVWLTGVAHIGDSNYYKALQAHLDGQTLVLYEGVGAAENQADAEDADEAQARKPEPTGAAPQGSLQSAMASSLGLVFQLDAIDYRRPNFRNSDLSITQLRELMTQEEETSGTAGASESFEDLLQMMSGNSWMDWLIQLVLRLLGANPKFQALGRLALIDLLGQIQGDPSRLEGMAPDMKQLLEVLLQRRNEKVITDLRAQVRKLGPHDSVAVFFGTGHMPDLEKRLRHQLRYRPVRNIWFTSFSVDLAQAGISASERKFIDDFVNWQLKQAGAVSGSSPDRK